MKWVTWENVGVDRIACAWLIRKHIDTKAKFLFVPKGTQSLPAGAELTMSQVVSVVLFNFFIVFPLFGTFVASFAAFYRRFLRNSNQAAAARRSQRSRQGTQKRPTSRPSTARARR